MTAAPTVANAGGVDDEMVASQTHLLQFGGLFGIGCWLGSLRPGLKGSLGLGEERTGSISKGSAYTADNPTIGQLYDPPELQGTLNPGQKGRLGGPGNLYGGLAAQSFCGQARDVIFTSGCEFAWGQVAQVLSR